MSTQSISKIEMELDREIPADVMSAAMLLENWVATHGGNREWQLMGVCSRDYAFKAERLDRLESQTLIPNEQSQKRINVYGNP